MLIDPFNWRSVEIEEIIRESELAVTIVVSKPKDYEYISGQHAVIRVSKPDKTKLVRQYSFASEPNTAKIKFTVIEEDGGEVSTWFNRLSKPGDMIEISQPFSGPLQSALNKFSNVTMIAGGSGIAPMMSHVTSNRNNTKPVNITLLYSCRSNTACYKQELTSNYDHENIVMRFTDRQSRFSNSEIIKHMRNADSVYICGSRSFVTHMRDVVSKNNPSIPIFNEAFTL